MHTNHALLSRLSLSFSRIDYRGFRLMASSVLPINETTLVYGSRDAGLTIHADLPAFNHSIESVLSTLNLVRLLLYLLYLSLTS